MGQGIRDGRARRLPHLLKWLLQPMDNLTHTALAVFLSRIGPGRWSPHGTAIILIGSNIPDIDTIMGIRGGLDYIHFHRHITHALIAMPLMALAAVGIVRLAVRKP